MIKEDHRANPLLETRELSISFGGLKALDRVNLRVDRGSIKAIIGTNGSGKTTLFNIVTGVYTPTSGRVFFEGQDITSAPSHKIAEFGIARTFQNIRLFREMSVLQNVMVGNHCRMGTGAVSAGFQLPRTRLEERTCERRATEMLRFVGFQGDPKAKASSLDYGNQRLLELARALCGSPHLIALDEPTAGMNLTETLAVMSTIRKIRDSGITVLLIEHNMRLVMGVAESIQVLNSGQVIAEGSPEQICADASVIEAYLGKSDLGC